MIYEQIDIDFTQYTKCELGNLSCYIITAP